MLIQPKRWVAPTVGAVLVLLVLATLWGRQNPESYQKISNKLPSWSSYRPNGGFTSKGNAPVGLEGENEKAKLLSTSTTEGGWTNPVYTEPAVAVPNVAEVVHGESSLTTTDIPPFPVVPAVTSSTTPPILGGAGPGGLLSSTSTPAYGDKAPAMGGGASATTTPLANALPPVPVAGMASITSTSQAAGGAPQVPAAGLASSSGAGDALFPTQGQVLSPILRPPPPPLKPGQIVISNGIPPNNTHHIIKARSTKTGHYFMVDMWGIRSYNPNLIPHSRYNDTWFVTTQRWKAPDDNQAWFTQMVCDAKWNGTTLVCTTSPLILPVQASTSEKCVGDLVYFNFNVGPHDARAFYGPDIPFLVYGTQSKYTCFGQFIQDLRVLTDWGLVGEAPFRFPTDMQRPDTYGRVEKNWFLFWDPEGNFYIHYDVKPHRVFAQLHPDGSVGPDLGISNRAKDDECLARHTENVEESVRKSLHQATNSLAVTMCNRTDPACKATDDNTFILSIFQQKSFVMFHGIYEPYVMLFRRQPPFETYAFGKKPMWMYGRNMPGEMSAYREIPDDQSEMVYLTSINWKEKGLNYHGFLDDVIFLGFGVEDSTASVIDVTAQDLIGDIMKC